MAPLPPVVDERAVLQDVNRANASPDLDHETVAEVRRAERIDVRRRVVWVGARRQRRRSGSRRGHAVWSFHADAVTDEPKDVLRDRPGVGHPAAVAGNELVALQGKTGPRGREG